MQNVGFRVIGVLSQRGANMMGVGPGRHHHRPVDEHQGRVSSTQLTNVNQSSALAVGSTMSSVTAATTVNTLNQSYPGKQDSIYPTIDPLRPIDYPQQTRFPNVDQIIARASSARRSPWPSARSPTCCTSATTSRPASRTTFRSET